GVPSSGFLRKMRLMRIILLWLMLAGAPLTGLCAQTLSQAEALPVANPPQHETGISQEAAEIGHIFGLPVTNSMVVTWIVALGLIVFAQVATRNMKQIPEGAQNFWEWMVESLYNFLEGIIGHSLVKKTFWFFATIFIFILFANWFGLIPGI